MKIGFLFPGQGSQNIGMGKDLYEKYEIVRNIYNKVKQLTGIDIAKITFEGPEELLNETKNTQLAILTMSLGILEILKQENIKCDIQTGLSLGEYTALIEDGIFNFEDGVKLVQKRGKIMQNLIPKGNWKMAAVLGLEAKKVEEACKKINGFVVPSNYNTIGQTVISGEEEYVVQAGEIAKEAGARKISVLNTSGPYHTSKLEECSKALEEELKKVTINRKQSKVVKNIDGKRYEKTDDVAEILSKHIMNPVRFSWDLQEMYDNGIDTFIEIRPRRSLSGFVKRMNFENPVQIKTINSIETLEEVIKEVTENE